MKAILLFVGGLSLTAACGSDTQNSTTASGAGGSGASGSDASGSGASGTGASGSGASGGTGAAGGASTATGTGGAGDCGPGMIHVFPCCGGPPPLCEPLPDGGTCPPGTHPANCPNGPGCEMDPCVAPPPYCADQNDVKCQGTNCSTANGDCFGTLQGTDLLCQCA